jgi:hypothetical protein
MNNIQTVNNKLQSYLYKKLVLQTLSGSINLLVVLLVIWLSTFLADHIFYFSVPVRWVVLIVNATLTLYLIYHLIFSAFLRLYRMKTSGNMFPLTKEIGQQLPHIGDALANIYQLGNSPQFTSSELSQLAVARFVAKIRNTEFNQKLRLGSFLLPASWIALVSTGSFILFLLTYDVLSVSAMRVFNPLGTYELVPEYSFTVTPGDTSLVKGGSLELVAEYVGPRSEKLFLDYHISDGDFIKQVEMEKVQDYYFGRIANLRESVEYQLRAIPEGRPAWRDKIKSDAYSIKVLTPPAITEIQVKIIPPRYTNLPVQLSDKNSGDIIAYTGSRIKLTAQTNKPVKTAQVKFSGRRNMDLQIRNQKLSADFTVKNSGAYYLAITDHEDLNNQNAIEYQISVLEDRYPFVELIDPGADIEMPPDAAINLLMEASDDFGFSDLNLNYQIISSVASLVDSAWYSIPVFIPEQEAKYFQQTYLWNFQNMEVGYGDMVNYYLAVTDNDRVSGPKRSQTRTYNIRFPSLDQLFSEFDNRQEENLEKTDEIAQDNEELKQKIEQLRRELKREKTIEWEKKKELQAIVEKQEQIQEKLADIDKALEETIQKMEQSQLLSPEILQKYQQLQELFRELMSPDLEKAMADLQKSLESLNKKQVDQALENMQFNQEEFKQNVERTLELFKKVKLEQELDRLAKLSQHMLQMQQEMNQALDEQKIDQEQTTAELERKTDQQTGSLEQIKNTLQNLESEPIIKEYPKTSQLLQQTDNLISQEEMTGKFDQLQKQIEQNKQKQARQNAQNLQNNLEQMAQNLQQAKDEFTSQAQDKITAQMQRATDNLLALSRQEEEIIRATKSASGISDQMRDLAAKQKEVADDASRVVKEIIELSQNTFAIPPDLGRALGKANNNMQKSISELEQRNQNAADKAQVQAMGALNEAVASLQQAMGQMQNANSPFGMEQFMEQMKQLTQGQGQVNQESLNFMQGQGGQPRLSPDGEQRLRQLAAQQRAIQESFDQLHDEYGEDNALGRLGKISEEMEEVVEDLEALNIDRRTIDRQQRILSRMLDAQKSIREKEYSKQRKSQVGKVYARKSPEEDMDTENKRAKKLQMDLMRALKEGYNPDYERLIEEYFKTLNQEYLKD